MDLTFSRYLAPVLVRRLYGAMVVILILSSGSALVLGATRCVHDATGSLSDEQEAKVAELIQRCVDDAQEEAQAPTSPAERLGLVADAKSNCKEKWERSAKREAWADASRARLPADVGETIGALVTCLLLGVACRILLELAIVQFRISETLDRIARRWEA